MALESAGKEVGQPDVSTLCCSNKSFHRRLAVIDHYIR